MVRTWGSTVEERCERLPCDDLLPRAPVALWRAVDVAAPAPVVFRWLCQLRAGPYSYDWLDNLGRRSPRELVAGLGDLAVGQRVMSIFHLAAFAPNRSLTLRLDRGRQIFGDVAVTYRVTPLAHGRTRLLAKVRWSPPGRRGRAAVGRALAAGDFVMMRKQLLTLKGRAEASAAAEARARRLGRAVVGRALLPPPRPRPHDGGVTFKAS